MKLTELERMSDAELVEFYKVETRDARDFIEIEHGRPDWLAGYPKCTQCLVDATNALALLRRREAARIEKKKNAEKEKTKIEKAMAATKARAAARLEKQLVDG